MDEIVLQRNICKNCQDIYFYAEIFFESNNKHAYSLFAFLIAK